MEWLGMWSRVIHSLEWIKRHLRRRDGVQSFIYVPLPTHFVHQRAKDRYRPEGWLVEYHYEPKYRYQLGGDKPTPVVLEPPKNQKKLRSLT